MCRTFGARSSPHRPDAPPFLPFRLWEHTHKLTTQTAPVREASYSTPWASRGFCRLSVDPLCAQESTDSAWTFMIALSLLCVCSSPFAGCRLTPFCPVRRRDFLVSFLWVGVVLGVYREGRGFYLHWWSHGSIRVFVFCLSRLESLLGFFGIPSVRC